MSNLFKNLFRNQREGDAVGSIDGTVPADLTGLNVLYNGPIGKYDFAESSAMHYYDGMAFMTSIKFNGTDDVTIRKRFLRSDALSKAEVNGRLIDTEYGTPAAVDSTQGFVSRLVASIVPGELTDNCACTFYDIGGTTVASTETCLLQVVDRETLETTEKLNMQHLVNIMSGRALKDPWSGHTYNLAGTFTRGKIRFHFVRFDKSDVKEGKEAVQESVIVGSIPSRMTTCHSFGLSRKYLVFIEQPWVANSVKLVTSKVKRNSFKDCLEWMPDEKNVIHVMDKESGKELKTTFLTTVPFFFLNHVNTYEDGRGNLVVDIIGYDDPTFLDSLYLDQLRSSRPTVQQSSKLMRFVLPLTDDLSAFNEGDSVLQQQVGGDDKGGESSASPSDSVNLAVAPDRSINRRRSSVFNNWPHYKATATKFGDAKVLLTPHLINGETGCECPIVGAHSLGRPYNFTYVTGWMTSVNKGFYANAVTKVNMNTGESIAWRGNEFQHPAEPTFIGRVKNPNFDDDSAALKSNEEEDDGWLVFTVTDVREDCDDFVAIVDAKDMKEVGRVSFPNTDIPFSGHAYSYFRQH